MPTRGEAIALESYLAGRDARTCALFDAVREAIGSIGAAELRATKSQVAFRRRIAFAWAWVPGQYLTGHTDLAPLVLSVGLGRHDPSPRWKQVIEPRPGRFMHHLELFDAEQLDDEVLGWLREAWELAE
jgi:hypothetical protein